MQILTARKNLRLKVTDKQADILVGCVLGDAYITKLGKIQIEQSAAQTEYINWKYNQLKSISYGPPVKPVSRYDKRYDKTFYSYRFWTRQYFRSWREKFYMENKKIFSLNNLSPLSLAVWYMDDGSLNEGKGAILSTESFSQEDREKIKNLFIKDFNIKPSFKKQGKMIIGTKDSKKFFSIIRPYVIPSMQYKLQPRND